MKILHVVQGYSPAIGGTERLMQKVSENLVASYGDEVTVYTTNAYNCELFWRRDQPSLPVGTEIINGVTVRRFPVFNRFNEARRLLAGSSYLLKLPFNDWLRALHNGPLIPEMTKKIAQTEADVIASSSFPLLHMHYALRGGRRAGIPVVFHGGIHTADTLGFDRPMIYKAIRQADAYIANSVFERDYLVDERGIAQEKISVIGVGVDLESFAQANGRSLRARLNWGQAPVVAFVGQQVPHKGVDMVLEALQQVWQTHPETCLIIAGARTTYSETIRAQIKQLPSARHSQIAIFDNFPESEKAEIFAACDILAFPSGHESFGIVFLEAWASRKPVIGANIGPIPTIINHGEDGLLIAHRSIPELTTAVRQLIEHPERARAMGEAGYAKVQQHYTWQIITKKFRDVYVQAKTRADKSYA